MPSRQRSHAAPSSPASRARTGRPSRSPRRCSLRARCPPDASRRPRTGKRTSPPRPSTRRTGSSPSGSPAPRAAPACGRSSRKNWYTSPIKMNIAASEYSCSAGKATNDVVQPVGQHDDAERRDEQRPPLLRPNARPVRGQPDEPGHRHVQRRRHEQPRRACPSPRCSRCSMTFSSMANPMPTQPASTSAASSSRRRTHHGSSGRKAQKLRQLLAKPDAENVETQAPAASCSLSTSPHTRSCQKMRNTVGQMLSTPSASAASGQPQPTVARGCAAESPAPRTPVQHTPVSTASDVAPA